jgi:hypothetical protein
MLYNSVINGIMNYYKFADNRKSLGNITHGLKMSCALTLALKLKLRTTAKVFKMFGSLLLDPESKLALKIPTTHMRLTHLERFNTGTGTVTTPENAIKLSYGSTRSVSMLDRPCVICGSTVGIQAHHVRKVRDLTQRTHLDFFTMQMAAINRKQVPLCAEHHKRLHDGSLNELERNAFSIGTQSLIKKAKKPEKVFT